ncbi:hypothetical protein E2562_010316 [Oryza meyeriana var. granulata]|uniref:Uncharacterized protein n=1 Tax=Oryza meyeriana var. granulata TaxID=110450 RepID=A0A6G1F699_9ORYZ|nr:hypothetical protein E2562_010316 [Oryza meyeriana var. granulata]
MKAEETERAPGVLRAPDPPSGCRRQWSSKRRPDQRLRLVDLGSECGEEGGESGGLSHLHQ